MAGVKASPRPRLGSVQVRRGNFTDPFIGGGGGSVTVFSLAEVTALKSLGWLGEELG